MDQFIYKPSIGYLEGRALALVQTISSALATHVGILPEVLAGRSTGLPKLSSPSKEPLGCETLTGPGTCKETGAIPHIGARTTSGSGESKC